MIALWRTLARAVEWFRTALAAWLAGPEESRVESPDSIGEWAP